MAWLPTLEEMRDRVFYVLRDSERAFTTATEIDYWLNEGYLDINARLRLNQKEATGTTDATTGTVTLPSDYLEHVDFWIGDVHPVFVDHDVFLSWEESGESLETAEAISRVWNGYIETYPLTTSEAYTLYYIGQPTQLTAAGHQPSSLTPELAVRVINYARAQAKWKEGEADEGDRYYSLYTEGLPGQPRLTHRKHPGRVDFIPDASPFEEG